MKKIAMFFIVFVVFAFLSFLVKTKAEAQELKQSKTVVLKEDQIVEGNYFASGELVRISGTVNGDVYIGAGNVVVDGTVNGDVLAAGGNINISGSVTQDVRVVGGQISVSGKVGGNVTAAGGNISLNDTAEIAGSVVLAGGSVSVSSPVGKTATIGAGQLTLNGSVNGDVLAGVGQLTLTEKANIQGNLTYFSDSAANIQKEAVVAGKTVHNLPKKAKFQKGVKPVQAAAKAYTTYKILSLLAAFVVGLIFLRLAPLFVKQTSSIIATKPWASLGLGFALLFLTPIAVLILLLTVIGIPLAVFALFAYFIYIYLAKVFVAYFVGEKVLNFEDKKKVSAGALFVGLLIYYALTFVPVLGWFVSFLTTLFGIGALAMSKKNSYLLLRSKNQV